MLHPGYLCSNKPKCSRSPSLPYHNVVSAALSMCNRLEGLSSNWTWSGDDLNLAGIGKPEKVIKNLEKRIYVPYVTDKV